jgi:sigma-B regulation protein RsbU (phosphoserine phosphatase)
LNQLENLTTLNRITETLNRAVDVHSVLTTTLAQLVELMGLETGWIFLVDGAAQEKWRGSGYVLAAHHNLPPALTLDRAEAWDGDCNCQSLCSRGRLTKAYNEVRCSRLAEAGGDRRGLRVHASVPLRSGDRVMGILNVAGPNWDAFSPQALALLTNVGSQMGAALERGRLYALLRERRIDEQAALLELSNQLLARLDCDEVLAHVAEEAPRLLDADACAVLLPADEPGCLEFRAASGWHLDPVAQGRRVPADDESGPGWVMRTQRPMVVEDLESHDPAAWLPDWVRAEGFRGHAIVPLLVEDRSIGTLVLDTRQPRLLDDDEVRFLRLIANQAAIAIEKARLYQAELQRQQFEHELDVGRQIQLGLLPRSCPTVPGWECAAIYEPARQVGGDFYDFFNLPGKPPRQGIVIADVATKGVPAALFMALSRTMIRTTALSGRSPAAALARANDLIRQDSRSDLFVSAFYGILDPDTGRLVYANAGHTRPLWLQAATGQVSELEGRGIVLGILPAIGIEEREVQIAPGDLLILYTDGVTEAADADDRLFGVQRLREIVTSFRSAAAQEVLVAILDAVRSYAGRAPAADDLTLVVIKRGA